MGPRSRVQLPDFMRWQSGRQEVRHLSTAWRPVRSCSSVMPTRQSSRCRQCLPADSFVSTSEGLGELTLSPRSRAMVRVGVG